MCYHKSTAQCIRHLAGLLLCDMLSNDNHQVVSAMDSYLYRSDGSRLCPNDSIHRPIFVGIPSLPQFREDDHRSAH